MTKLEITSPKSIALIMNGLFALKKYSVMFRAKKSVIKGNINRTQL